MFVLLESAHEVADAQGRLSKTISNAFNHRLRKNIGYPGGTRKNELVRASDKYWGWSLLHRSKKHPRWLNWFGVNPSKSMLEISVEVNVPLKGHDMGVAGWFARDSETGAVHLFHSGRVGGGTTGVSRRAFLAWRNGALETTIAADGTARVGVPVMSIDSATTIAGLFNYIDEIAAFKIAVRSGDLNNPDFERRKQRFGEYFAEVSGVRKRKRSAEIEYITRHGDIVEALHTWRVGQPFLRPSKVVKDILIDLGVAIDDELIEIYEVKTNARRTNIYSAIGQLLVHGKSDGCRRVLVLPQGEQLAPDLDHALSSLKIDILRFRLHSAGAAILESR